MEMSFFRWFRNLFRRTPFNEINTNVIIGNKDTHLVSQKKLSEKETEKLIMLIEGCLYRAKSIVGTTTGERANRTLKVRLFSRKSDYIKYGRKYITGFTDQMDFCYWPSEQTIFGYHMPERKLKPRLRHECVHFLINCKLPLWIEEGVAELSEGGVQVGHMRRAAYSGLTLPAQEIDREELYKGKVWYAMGYALALYYYQQGRLLHIISGDDKGGVNQDAFYDFILNSSMWRKKIGNTPYWSNDWNFR
ncbi:MAG: hypothetical protein F6K48_03390 [Okeania sp. SIO3H1]|nr:hypothetical protein [Okeania sp. SIO3H1]